MTTMKKQFLIIVTMLMTSVLSANPSAICTEAPIGAVDTN